MRHAPSTEYFLADVPRERLVHLRPGLWSFCVWCVVCVIYASI